MHIHIQHFLLKKNKQNKNWLKEERQVMTTEQYSL